MYTIQLDTVKNFECTLKIQGASLTKSKVNLVIESNDMDIRCRGTINEKGKVSIPVKKLKGILDENSKGKMYLEVIAEDSYFTPYKTDYITELSKKVDISENITVKSVKKIVEAETQDIQCHAGKIIKSITESKLNICNPISCSGIPVSNFVPSPYSFHNGASYSKYKSSTFPNFGTHILVRVILTDVWFHLLS